MLHMALLDSYEFYKSNIDARQRRSCHDYLCSVMESLCAAENPAMTVMPPAVSYVRRYILDHTCQANGSGNVLFVPIA